MTGRELADVREQKWYRAPPMTDAEFAALSKQYVLDGRMTLSGGAANAAAIQEETVRRLAQVVEGLT